MPDSALVRELTLPLPLSIDDIPDQAPFVQAGMEYLRSLYDVKALFSTFDLDNLNINRPDSCILAQAQTFENGGEAGTYHDFLGLHILPSLPTSLGFAICTSMATPSHVDAKTERRLTAAWKQAITNVLAE